MVVVAVIEFALEHAAGDRGHYKLARWYITVGLAC